MNKTSFEKQQKEQKTEKSPKTVMRTIKLKSINPIIFCKFSGCTMR